MYCFLFVFDQKQKTVGFLLRKEWLIAKALGLYPFIENKDRRDHSERSEPGQEKRPPQQSNTRAFPAASERRDTPGRGAGRPNSKFSGMIDPYGIDIAPLNVFENQVIPIGIHNLSKSFRPI